MIEDLTILEIVGVPVALIVAWAMLKWCRFLDAQTEAIVMARTVHRFNAILTGFVRELDQTEVGPRKKARHEWREPRPPDRTGEEALRNDRGRATAASSRPTRAKQHGQGLRVRPSKQGAGRGISTRPGRSGCSHAQGRAKSLCLPRRSLLS